ncbi:hypothetical protein [Ekhidna sp. To15]|uniref:hypothetical protein n=1 Tax=Ekhidna sp. To15 TaxID=3395267 RepID=UPI003F51E186
MVTIKESFESNPIYFGSLIVCGTIFFLKGIDYLILGSIVPFIVGTLMLSGIYYALSKKNKSSRRIIKIVAVMLVLWGVARLGIEILFSFTSITEAHIRSQFTWPNRILSIGSISFGIYFLRKQRQEFII